MRLKILLVDDEPGTLRFLAHIIQSYCPEWEVVDTAENGHQAVPAIGAHMPDAVLTDIRMPVMDGVALAQHLHETAPDIYTLVISGYEDFEAARSLTRYGISDYLLKPIDPDNLVAVLKKLAEQVLNKRHQITTRLLAEAAAGKLCRSADQQRYLPVERFRATLLRGGAPPSRHAARLVSSDLGIEQNLPQLPEKCWLVAGRDDAEWFLFQSTQPHCSESLNTTVQWLRERLKRLFHYCTTIVYSSSFSLCEAGQAVTAMLDALNHHLVLGLDQEVDCSQPPAQSSAWKAISLKLEHKIVAACSGCFQAEELQNILTRFFDNANALRTPLFLVRQDLLRIIHAVGHGLESRAIAVDDREQQIDQIISCAADLRDLQSRFWNMILDVQSGAEMQNIAPGTRLFFEKVQSYLDGNLSQTISLSSICRAMGISQTYMSRIFRRQTGQSFNKYLTALRIHRAKEIIEATPGIPLKHVSEMVGFKDPLYFSKVFRAIEGVPPSAYMSQ